MGERTLKKGAVPSSPINGKKRFSFWGKKKRGNRVSTRWGGEKKKKNGTGALTLAGGEKEPIVQSCLGKGG